MILPSVLVYVPALLAGFGVVHLLWESRGSAWSLPLKAFLGIGLGLGLTSSLYFFRLLLFPGQGGYIWIESGLLVAVLSALIFRRRFKLDQVVRPGFPTGLQVGLMVAAVLVVFSALSYSLSFARVSPHGDYDAQAIWNLRARFIYRSGDAWEQAFSPEINRNFHMDYPLLIPLNVVGGWNTLNGEILRVPAIQSMFFLYGLAGVLLSAIAYLRSSAQAALSLIVLLATPRILLMTGFQTADIAVAYYFLATLVLLVLALREDNSRLLMLSGCMAAYSAWTKNEGLPFLILAGLSVWLLFRHRTPVPRLQAFLAGAALPLMTILLFKAYLPASHANDLFAGNPFLVILGKVFDPARYVAILSRLFIELGGLGGWPFSILIVLLVYGLVMGVTHNTTMDRRWSLLPLFQLLIYLGVYLITPHEVKWHMNYSMDRLLVHLFPMALLTYFLWVNTPEEVLGFHNHN